MYEDDISTPYYMFIAPRTEVIIDNIKKGFPLSKAFKTNKTLSKNMYENKYDYTLIKFVENFNAYISMYFDYETVDIDNLKIGKKGRVSTGYEIDKAFMGVFCFFKGRDIKPFYIVAILLQDENEFPVEYENIDAKLEIVYVKTQKEFFLTKAMLYCNFRSEKTGGWNNLGYDWKFTIRKLYELNIFQEFYKIATGKEREIEDIIKYFYKEEFITINANEKTKHYYIKIEGTEEYDHQTIFRQHFGTLSKWSLNTILGKLKLDLKLEFSIDEMYEILHNCYSRNYDETRKRKCTIILEYCIRDCIAPKEANEHINKITEYRLVSELTNITMIEYSHGNKTKMINNTLVLIALLEGFNISFKYNEKHEKEDFGGGTVKEPNKEYSFTFDICLDFNSLYPNLMMQNNICFLTKIGSESNEECHEISVDMKNGNTKIGKFSKNKRGLVPLILSLFVKRRKEAKVKRDEYDKGNLLYDYYNILQDLLKRIANSIYGQTGNPYSIICDYDISAAVTSFGQKYIEMASNYMKRYTPLIINDIVKKYEYRLLEEGIGLEKFTKIIYDIQEDMMLSAYDDGIELQNEINDWFANKMGLPRIVMEMEK
ncbi:13444_t:CDS:2, partial [Cetraspora pellucida]